MGQSLGHLAGDLFHTAQSFLMGQLATIGIHSEFAATAILAVLGAAVAWGLFLAVLSLLFSTVSRAFGRSDAAVPVVHAARAAERGQRAEPRVAPAKEPRLSPVAPGPGRLDVAPERLAAAKAAIRRPMEPAPERREPSLDAMAAEAPAPVSAEPAEGHAQSMGEVLESLGFEAPDDGAKLPYRKVTLDAMPHLAPLGRAGFSRPEWTGAIAPASMQDAGAYEVCRFKLKVPATSGNRIAEGRQSEQTVDYRICSLPRVSSAGSRRPDLLVYTTSDRGMAPKAGGTIKRK